MTKNAKLIANHFNTFFTSVAAKLNEKIVKAKKPFSHYLGETNDEIKLLALTVYQQKYFKNSKLNSLNH